MAFRRKNRFRTRFSRNRKIPARAIPRSIARVRKQKIVAFNTMQACEHTCVEEDGESCTTNMTVVLLRNVELQDLFGDNCKVARISGALHVDPWFFPPYTIGGGGEYGETGSWLTYFNLMSRTILQGRCGMVKTQSNSAEPDNPQPDYVIADSFDWSEGPWMRQWNHMWFPKETLAMDHLMQGNSLGICSNVSKASTIVPPTVTGNNPGWVDSAIVTVCNTEFEGSDAGAPQLGHRSLPPMRPWRIPLTWNRDITMKENQNLELKLSFSSLSPGADCSPLENDICEIGTGHAFPCLFRIVPNVLLTIQYG